MDENFKYQISKITQILFILTVCIHLDASQQDIETNESGLFLDQNFKYLGSLKKRPRSYSYLPFAYIQMCLPTSHSNYLKWFVFNFYVP